jgi:uncharacterized protein YprB with RNaseH-like and TPR domain
VTETVGGRSLATRLAAIRAERRPPPLPRAARPPDRAEELARWFGARLELADGAATVVLERSIRLKPVEAAALRGLSRAVYFDTETTGLSTGAGTVPFLAGLGVLAGDTLVVRQLLLPDYPHERGLLRRLCAELADGQRIVTYNGRGFDLPLLASRLTVHGFFAEQAALPAVHDDLLPVARRLWRRPLGGARLADVESAVLGVRRSSDCPSAEVPLRYFGYLNGGSPESLVAVLDHNLQDIVSLARLEAAIMQLRAGAWRWVGLLDHRGFALELIRLGEPDTAREVLEHALAGGGRQPEALHLRRLAARLLVAAGEPERAERLWLDGARGASVEAAWAWVEVARLRERQVGDLRGALEAVAAASRSLDLAFALGRGGGIGEIGTARIAIERRLRRLRRWVAARERRDRRAGRAAYSSTTKPGPPRYRPGSAAIARPDA